MLDRCRVQPCPCLVLLYAAHTPPLVRLLVSMDANRAKRGKTESIDGRMAKDGQSFSAGGLAGRDEAWRTPSEVREGHKQKSTELTTSSARRRSTGGLLDQLRRKLPPGRSTSTTTVASAIPVNAPTLGGWYLLQGQAIAITCTTGVRALPFGGLSRREGARGEIGLTRIERSRNQCQKHCKEHRDDGKTTAAIFHGSPIVEL